VFKENVSDFDDICTRIVYAYRTNSFGSKIFWKIPTGFDAGYM
jgi:hypothetical protein